MKRYIPIVCVVLFLSFALFFPWTELPLYFGKRVLRVTNFSFSLMVLIFSFVVYAVFKSLILKIFERGKKREKSQVFLKGKNQPRWFSRTFRWSPLR